MNDEHAFTILTYNGIPLNQRTITVERTEEKRRRGEEKGKRNEGKKHIIKKWVVNEMKNA